MRPVLLSVASLLAVGYGQAAGNPSVFAVSVKAVDGPLSADQFEKQVTKDDLRPRPNGSTAYHLYVWKPNKAGVTVAVEAGGKVIDTVPVDGLPAVAWSRVKFAAKPPAPAPVTPPPPPGTPAPEPTPPGAELARGESGFPVTFKLLDKDGKQVDTTDRDGKLVATVSVAAPADYLDVARRTSAPEDKIDQVTLGFVAKARGQRPSTLKLSFPKFGNTAGLLTRDGVYARTLTPKEKLDGPDVQLKGAAAGFGGELLAHVAADGVERAFVFRGKTGDKQLVKVDDPAVRVFPAAGAPATAAVTKPVEAFPVRVEVDNPKDVTGIELQVKRVSDTAAEEVEVVKLPGARDERVWLTVGGQEGLEFATRSRDWVHRLNLADARGRLEVTPKLVGVTPKPGDVVPLAVVVDATPPEIDPADIAFTNLTDDKLLVKGQPLRVSAVVSDRDSEVTKVTFLLGPPGEDGKPSPEAAKAVAVPTRVGTAEAAADGPYSGEWTAALAVPADKRGQDISLWVQATDRAGQTATSDPKTIVLVEGTPPGPKPGKIEGKVVFGDRPQPGLTVNLEADGKPKGTTKTDDKGKFTFDKLPPGAYKVGTAKTDTTTGLIGGADVAVEAGATAKATVTLTKNRPK